MILFKKERVYWKSVQCEMILWLSRQGPARTLTCPEQAGLQSWHVSCKTGTVERGLLYQLQSGSAIEGQHWDSTPRAAQTPTGSSCSEKLAKAQEWSGDLLSGLLQTQPDFSTPQDPQGSQGPPIPTRHS